jgi:hypothetical protein
MGETDNISNVNSVTVGDVTAFDHATATAIGSVNKINDVTPTLRDGDIVFEHGEGKEKTRLTFPKDTPGDVVAKAISAAVGNQKEEGA